MSAKEACAIKKSDQRNFILTIDDTKMDFENKNIESQRAKAYDIFKKLSLPNKKVKDWRKTKLINFDPQKFKLLDYKETAVSSIPSKIMVDDLSPQKTFGYVHHRRGLVREMLSSSLKGKGVIFTDLFFALKNYGELVETHLGKIINPSDGKLAALTSAFSKQGLFCYIPKNIHITDPLFSSIQLDDDYEIYPFHVIIYLDDGSTATIFHRWSSPKKSKVRGLYSGITEIFIGKNATLNILEIQDLNKESWNFTHERARVNEEGVINWFYFARGSRFTKSNIGLDLVGVRSKGVMTGVYLPKEKEHFEFDIRQNHYAPETKSDLLFRGVIKDASASFWQGMIFVDNKGMKSDGYQLNNSLILSPSAHVNSNPGLEILTDDVRCSHGVAITEIDKEQLFYLQSRGIKKESGEKLIIDGFLNATLSRAGDKNVVKYLKENNILK